jgi:hypothetical protein
LFGIHDDVAVAMDSPTPLTRHGLFHRNHPPASTGAEESSSSSRDDDASSCAAMAGFSSLASIASSSEFSESKTPPTAPNQSDTILRKSPFSAVDDSSTTSSDVKPSLSFSSTNAGRPFRDRSKRVLARANASFNSSGSGVEDVGVDASSLSPFPRARRTMDARDGVDDFSRRVDVDGPARGVARTARSRIFQRRRSNGVSFGFPRLHARANGRARRARDDCPAPVAPRARRFAPTRRDAIAVVTRRDVMKERVSNRRCRFERGAAASTGGSIFARAEVMARANARRGRTR